MSAYVVDKKHIDALMTWASRPHYGRESHYFWPEYKPECEVTFYDNLDTIGQKLWDENNRSVNYRYDEQNPNQEYHFEVFPKELTPVQIIKACNCWRYQSCETDDHKLTEAWYIVDQIRERAIGELPGMDSALWNIF